MSCVLPRRFVAPGKLVLVGEYAVLDGAPAIVAAIDRGVACTVWPSVVRSITAPDDRFVRAALDAEGAPPADYAFADWNPPALPGKAGFGGSAAATVAAVLAARAKRGRPVDAAALHAAAAPVHHAVQGSGSGIDVAASAYGGVIRFEAGAVTAVAPVTPLVVWSGASAKTGPRVERYRAWAGRDAFVRASAAIVAAFAGDPIGALRENRRLLEAMAAEAGLDYHTPALDRIIALADAHGGAAKPSGAGGGDVAVALFADPDAGEAFLAACAADGLVPVPVGIAPGAREVDGSRDAAAAYTSYP